MERYVLKRIKQALVLNMRTVLPLSALVDDHMGPFQGQRNHLLTWFQARRFQNGKTTG
jgi:hypothetical protein